MKIETKYDVGTHIWVVYEYHKEARVYDTYITEITYGKNGLIYFTDEVCELKEDEIILYEDKETLHNQIIEIMVKLNEKEKNNEKI